MPKCPFCGVRLGRVESFITKNKSVYKCKNCGKLSEVTLRRGMFILLCIVQILAVILFLISMFLGEGFYLVGIALILVIFGVFYWMSTYMIDLEEPRYIRRKIPWYKKIFFKRKEKTRKEIPKKEDSPSGDDEKEIYSN